MMSLTFGLYTQVSDSGPHESSLLWKLNNENRIKLSLLVLEMREHV